MIRLQFFHTGALHILIPLSKLSPMSSRLPFGILSFSQLSLQNKNSSTIWNEISVRQTVVSSTSLEYALQSLTTSPVSWLLDLDSLRNSPAKYSSCKKRLYVHVFNHWKSWINDNWIQTMWFVPENMHIICLVSSFELHLIHPMSPPKIVARRKITLWIIIPSISVQQIWIGDPTYNNPFFRRCHHSFLFSL